DIGKQLMMCLEEDLLTLAISMCLVVLCTFTIIDHLGKFDAKSDNGFFLGYSQVAKEFRVLDSPDEIPKLITPNAVPELTTTDNNTGLNKHDNSESFEDLGFAEDQVPAILKPINNADPTPISNLPLAEVFTNPLVPQDRWSKENHIELVNILGKPQAGITTRSIIRDSEAASAHECLYVHFLSEIEPKKIIEALEEEGWIIAMQEELN
nr:retrovirus-related Pol polyprotein from transposon TNT 1-94 [Tanacetum cinerariifolium]